MALCSGISLGTSMLGAWCQGFKLGLTLCKALCKAPSFVSSVHEHKT